MKRRNVKNRVKTVVWRTMLRSEAIPQLWYQATNLIERQVEYQVWSLVGDKTHDRIRARNEEKKFKVRARRSGYKGSY